MTNLWIEGMKAPLRHIKGITSGTHSAPEKIWLPFHASKGCQGTIHYMSLQDIVQLGQPDAGCRDIQRWTEYVRSYTSRSECYTEIYRDIPSYRMLYRAIPSYTHPGMYPEFISKVGGAYPAYWKWRLHILHIVHIILHILHIACNIEQYHENLHIACIFCILFCIFFCILDRKSVV
jgi:hypothetical protein